MGLVILEYPERIIKKNAYFYETNEHKKLPKYAVLCLLLFVQTEVYADIWFSNNKFLICLDFTRMEDLKLQNDVLWKL